MRNSTKVVVFCLFVLAAACLAEPWTATLTLSGGGHSFALTFGRLDGAEYFLDDEDDILAIPPPSGPYAYFSMHDPENPYVTMLYRDIRPDDGDSTMWIAHFITHDAPLLATWAPAELPAGDFFITAHYPGEDPETWTNMKNVGGLEFMPAQLLKIVHQPDGYYPSDDPVFSNWHPADGATGVSVRSEIWFDVTDEGSGINPASIELLIGGVDVTAEIALAPIANGYRVHYVPAEPLPGETWISVVASAEDNAHEPNSASDVISFRTSYSISPVDWEVPLFAYNIAGADTQFVDLFFGGDADASAGWDVGLDIIFPMAPPSLFYAYFPLNDPEYPIFTMLTRDIRSSETPFEQWIVRFGNYDDAQGLRWNPADLAADKDFFIFPTFPGVYPMDWEWQNMRDIDHIEFGPGRQAWIKVITPTGDVTPPRVVFTDPEDGETGVAISTHIRAGIIDLESGVDPASIAMTVDGIDVTVSLMISTHAETTFVRYIPPEDFDPLQNVTVTLSVSDMADPPNWTERTWNFVTGYFMTPEWVETLFVWTDAPGDPLRHFRLQFGADSEGTDGFDYGLDQQQPPAPPGDMPFGYFVIDDPLWGQLSRDIRNSADDNITWRASIQRVAVSDEIDNWISWNPEGLPEDGHFRYAWWVGGDTVWHNMRTDDHFEIGTPGIFFINFRRLIPPTYCLFGTVYDDEENPLEGALVWLSEELNAITNADGVYEICGIEPGEWTVITSLEGYHSDEHRLAILENTEYDPVLTPIEPAWATVLGHVSCADGGEPVGAMVILGDDTTFADGDGFYSLEEVPYGERMIHVSLANYVPQSRLVTIDEPVVEENFLLVRQIGQIVGTIQLSDDPPNLSGTQVELLGTGIPPVFTNMRGGYLISGVPYGEYEVRMSREGYETHDTSFALFAPEDTLDALLNRLTNFPPPRNLAGRGTYSNRIILSWDAPESSPFTLQGYNIYRRLAFGGGDTLVGYVPAPYRNFVEWGLFNYLPYNYLASAVYTEGESEKVGPLMVWLNPEETSPDVLIWDYDNGALLANQGTIDEAEFLRQRISAFGDLEVEVTGQDENLGDRDLFAYRAIFLITGVDDEVDAVPNNMSVNNLSRYIAAGGRVYTEGADFAYDFGRDSSPPQRKNLFEFFGAKYVADGYSRNDGNVLSLLGENTSFFTEGVVHVSYDFQGVADQRIDEFDVDYLPEGVSFAMFSQEHPSPMISNLRMLYRSRYNWRTVLSSVYIGAMNDGPPPSTRQHVVAAVLNFLLGTDFTFVEETKDRLPEQLALSASPNPFNAACKFEIEIDEPGNIDLKIYDISGREVAALADGYVAPGFYSVVWDGTSDNGARAASGIYFAVLRCGDRVARTRIALLK